MYSAPMPPGRMIGCTLRLLLYVCPARLNIDCNCCSIKRYSFKLLMHIMPQVLSVNIGVGHFVTLTLVLWPRLTHRWPGVSWLIFFCFVCGFLSPKTSKIYGHMFWHISSIALPNFQFVCRAKESHKTTTSSQDTDLKPWDWSGEHTRNERNKK